jgi:hypothetical protein
MKGKYVLNGQAVHLRAKFLNCAKNYLNYF